MTLSLTGASTSQITLADRYVMVVMKSVSIEYSLKFYLKHKDVIPRSIQYTMMLAFNLTEKQIPLP